MEEEFVVGERRKILAKSLPFMINAVWEAHTVLSPANLASAAASEYQRLETSAKLREEEIKSLKQDIGHLNLQSESTGRISLTLTRSEILELTGNYLISQFRNDGSAGSKFTVSSSHQGYEGMLNLPNKAVFSKLVREKIDQNWIFSEVDKAESLNPAEVWIFAYHEHRFDVRFDPVFLSETRIMRGRFKLLPLTEMIGSITRGSFLASIESSGESEVDVTRFMLTRIDQVR